MPKKARDYHLDEKELAEIETAIRQDKRPEVRVRCTAIRLLHLGHKPAEIARMQAISIPTVYSWYNRWREAGIEGLATKPRSGRPLKTGEEYWQALEETLEKDPHELGYDFSIWTLERLRLHLEKVTGISLSMIRLHILLKRQGYRYRRPKYDLGHLQDKEAKAKAAALVEELKKSPPETLSSSSLWTKRR
jgi:transposase